MPKLDILHKSNKALILIGWNVPAKLRDTTHFDSENYQNSCFSSRLHLQVDAKTFLAFGNLFYAVEARESINDRRILSLKLLAVL